MWILHTLLENRVLQHFISQWSQCGKSSDMHHLYTSITSYSTKCWLNTGLCLLFCPLLLCILVLTPTPHPPFPRRAMRTGSGIRRTTLSTSVLFKLSKMAKWFANRVASCRCVTWNAALHVVVCWLQGHCWLNHGTKKNPRQNFSWKALWRTLTFAADNGCVFSHL